MEKTCENCGNRPSPDVVPFICRTCLAIFGEYQNWVAIKEKRMKKESEKERFVVCVDCKNNDETCSLCAPSLCISGSNFEPKSNEKDEPMTTMAHDAMRCETCGKYDGKLCHEPGACMDYDKCVPKEKPAETACSAEKRPAATPEPMPAKDPKARYYDAGGIEVLDVIKAKLTPDQYKGWLLGNLIKYSCRANFKDQISRDIEKVAFYSAEMFKFLEV